MSARPGDWCCPRCSTVNFASRNECRNRCSGVTRPSNAGPPAPKAGDWKCACGANNFASRNMCFGCQKPKSSPTPAATTPQSAAPVVKAGDWVCPNCSTNNFASRSACFKCQKPKAAAVLASNTPAQPIANASVPEPSTTVMAGDWKCLLCGANNFASRTECYGCNSPKGTQPPTTTSTTTNSDVVAPSTTVKAGDWVCPNCSTNNFGSRSACFKCRAPKPSGGSPAAAGGNGPTVGAPNTAMSKPGDWSCGQCSFSNFGSRVACLQCGAPRPTPSGGQTAGGSGTVAASDAAILGTFALPSYWKVSAKTMKPELVESGYFSDVASTLWSKFTSATSGKKITRVVRVENVALWHGYCAEVQRLVSKHPQQAPPIPMKWAPKTLQILPDTFNINETYLCHGTSPAVANLIVENGFDPSHSGESAGALFGQGTYFSDSLDKVMRYTAGCVVVARVALGDVAVPPHPGSTSNYRRPPAKKSGDEYDSLVATASHTQSLKEFIVYRHTKAYPEYLIFHD